MTFASNSELYADLDLRTREQRQKDDNEAAAADPQPGDYWHEMFVSYCVVIARVGNQVATFDDTIEHPGGYTYDTSKITWRTLDEHRARMRYQGIDGWVADVNRRGRIHVIEQWREEGGHL